ncbi:MAG TPA: guanylate kinase [Bryobacterales bacterium]|nr:guanylate kinase [Bryobacterales bacterium]
MSVVLIISAPSGSGKSTLARHLVESDPQLDFSTSVTTRPPRPGDEEGKSYSFVSKDEFFAMRDRGDLLEWAEVFGNYYGTSRAVLDLARQRGHDLLLDIDVQGASQLMERLPEAVTVFILPPSRTELESRLRNRSSDSNEVIERRLNDAAREVANLDQYDYVLVNDDLDETLEELKSILAAERRRKGRMTGRIQSIIESFQIGTKI